jgi:hypothetical protein
MHMPLHVGDNKDKGGDQTQVRFFDEGTSMRRLWDSDMIEHEGNSEDFWVADPSALDTGENCKAWMGGTVEEWATESLLLARAAHVVPEWRGEKVFLTRLAWPCSSCDFCCAVMRTVPRRGGWPSPPEAGGRLWPGS